MIRAARPEETIGTSFVRPPPCRYWGRSNGNPAPEKITSIPSSIAAVTSSAKFASATMMLTPRTPWGLSAFARRISARRARVLAARKFWKKSASAIPMPAQAMTPIPPAAATAPASPARDTPTPMPPWMMGSGAVRSPMRSAGGRRSAMSGVLSLRRRAGGAASAAYPPGLSAEPVVATSRLLAYRTAPRVLRAR